MKLVIDSERTLHADLVGVLRQVPRGQRTRIMKTNPIQRQPSCFSRPLIRAPKVSVLAGLAAAWVMLVGPAVRGQTADGFNPVPNGPVYSMSVQPDGKVVIGGWFTQLGSQAHWYIARLNADGTPDAGFNPGGGNDYPASLVLQENGKILVGGGFTYFAEQNNIRYLVRLNANGTLDTSFDTVAGSEVNALLVQADGKLLVGGWFTSLLYYPRSYIGRYTVEGWLDWNFNPGADNLVYGFAAQPDGKILVGGLFTTLGGQARNCIGRLDGSGTLDPNFDPGADGWVSCLAVQPDGKILVGGRFTTLGGWPCNRLGRLNSDGTPDTGFDAGISGDWSSVSTLVLQADGKLLVGGDFTSLGGTSRSYMGRLNPDGTLDTSFNPGANGAVDSLTLQPDGKILVGGDFNMLGGQARSRMGRLINTGVATQNLTLNGSTVTWQRGGTSPEVWRTAFELSTNGTTWTSLGTGARISGGWQLGGVSVPTGGYLRARGYVSSGYNNASGGFVESVIGPPLIAGQPVDRTNNAGTTATFSVALSSSGSNSGYQWRKEGVNLANAGRIMGANTDTLTLSSVMAADMGGYSVVASNSSGTVTSLVARLTVLEPIITNQPSSITVNAGQTALFTVGALGSPPLSYRWRKDGSPVAGGSGDSLNLTNVLGADAGKYDVVVTNTYGSTTSAVAVLTLNPAIDLAFNPAVLGGAVFSVAVQADGKILLAGSFTNLCGQSRSKIGRLNPDGTLDTAFNPGASGGSHGATGGLHALAVQPDGKILVGGIFTTLAGQSRTNLGRLNADGTIDPGFDPAPDGPWVDSLALQPDGKILVGGWFGRLAGQACVCFGRLNPDGSLDATFTANAADEVYSMAIQPDGKILVGGVFGILNGVTRNNIGRYNSNGTLDTTFNPGANWTVFSLAVQPDGKALVGGYFNTLGGQYRTNLGRLSVTGTVDSFNPRMNLWGYVFSLALQADGRVLVGGAFTNVAGQVRNRLARLNPDGTSDTSFNLGADGGVLALTVQPDGDILVGGAFTNLGGQVRSGLARIHNSGPATKSLIRDGSTLTWLRGGTSPEVWRTTFEASTNGTDWFNLGAGTRITGGWQLTALSAATNAALRARGFAVGGCYNGTTWFEQSILPGAVSNPPTIVLNDGAFGFRTNRFGFNLTGGGGQRVVIEASTNLADWSAMQTNVLGDSALYFSDPAAASMPRRFYRVR